MSGLLDFYLSLGCLVCLKASSDFFIGPENGSNGNGHTHRRTSHVLQPFDHVY